MATCTSADSILEAMALIKADSAKIDKFTNGTASETVQLGTGNPTPVLRKFIADAQAIVDAFANPHITEATIDGLFD